MNGQEKKFQYFFVSAYVSNNSSDAFQNKWIAFENFPTLKEVKQVFKDDPNNAKMKDIAIMGFTPITKEQCEKLFSER